MNDVREWVESVLGEYEAPTYIQTEVVYLPDGGYDVEQYEVIPSGFAGVDWHFVTTGLFLLISVYSVFRLLGVLLQSLSGGRRV